MSSNQTEAGKKSRQARENSRSGQRLFAFQVLYAINFVPSKQSLEYTFKRFQNCPDQNVPDAGSFAWTLVHGVWDNIDELDRTISSYSKNWKIERIAKIELTIMRLSVYEMCFCPDIPLKVAINEGIELAKTFGDENSRNFVNGILDAVARDIKNGKFGISKGF